MVKSVLYFSKIIKDNHFEDNRNKDTYCLLDKTLDGETWSYVAGMSIGQLATYLSAFFAPHRKNDVQMYNLIPKNLSLSEKKKISDFEIRPLTKDELIKLSEYFNLKANLPLEKL